MEIKKIKPSNRVFKMYLMTLCIFIILIFVIYSIKQVTRRYYDETVHYYKEQQWEIVFANIRSIYNFGRYNTEVLAEEIEADILTELDLDILKMSLTNNIYYNDLNNILKHHLTHNPFTFDSSINGKRNGLFVISNNHIIGSYPYNEYFGSYSTDNLQFEVNNTLDQLIENAYNKELTKDAINKLKSQSKDYIIWQLREPLNPSSIKYERITLGTLKHIFETEGIYGFESYGFLIPAYITEYGNIFGDLDQLTNRNNKIIIVQKVNLTDYFTVYVPDLFDNHEIDALTRIYDIIEFSILFFELVLYVSIIVYLIFVIYNINYIIDKTKKNDDE